MYVCMGGCTDVRVCVRMYECMSVCLSVCMYVCMYMYTYIHTYVHMRTSRILRHKTKDNTENRIIVVIMTITIVIQ